MSTPRKRTQTDPDGSRILAESLSPDQAIGWNLGRLVKELSPGKAVLGGIGSPFDVEEFARGGHCEISLATDSHSELSISWKRTHGLSESANNGVYDVRWRKHALRVVVASWKVGWESRSESLVVADTDEIAREFANAVCAYCNDPGRSILLFNGGCWSRSHELWEQIQAATLFEHRPGLLAGARSVALLPRVRRSRRDDHE